MKFEFEIETEKYSKAIKLIYDNDAYPKLVLEEFRGSLDELTILAKKLSTIQKEIALWERNCYFRWKSVKEKGKHFVDPAGDKFHVIKNKKISPYIVTFFLDTATNTVRKFEGTVERGGNEIWKIPDFFYSARPATEAVKIFLAKKLLPSAKIYVEANGSLEISRISTWQYDNWNSRGTTVASKVGIL